MKHLLLTTIAAVVLVGCGKGYVLEYGQPAAQFLAKDVAAKAKAYKNKKVTIKGTVTRVDITNPNSPRIYLKEGIECNFGRLKLMASRCKVGDTVYVDGILNISDQGNIFLDPAVKRDPTAKFIPIKAEVK